MNCNDTSDLLVNYVKNHGNGRALYAQDTPYLIACGHGNVILEAVIPSHEMWCIYDGESPNYLSWGLYLFSMSANKIIGSVECDRFPSNFSSSTRSVASFRYTSTNDDSGPCCNFAVWDHRTSTVLMGDVYSRSEMKWLYTSIQVPIHSATYSACFPESTFREELSKYWDRFRKTKYLVLTPSDLIVVCECDQHTTICFYLKNADNTLNATPTEIKMPRHDLVMEKPFLIRDHYMALILRNFLVGATANVVIHVPSRTVVCRI
jgi:hypothetical protein